MTVIDSVFAAASIKPRSRPLRASLVWVLLPLLGSIACGPPKTASAPEGESESSDEDPDSTAPDSTGEGTDTGTDTEPGIIPDTDMGEGTQSCDPFMQDCPPDEKCVPYASNGTYWDANKCVPVLGSQAQGEPCMSAGPMEATDDCDETGACWWLEEVDGEWLGTCFSFCTGSAETPVCEQGYHCAISASGPFNYCFQDCDPIAQDCDDGLGCYWEGSMFECVFTSEDIPIGAACAYINDCAPGLVCVDQELLPACEGASCCSTFCDLVGAPDQCDALPGSSCVAFFPDNQAPPGYEQVGVCIVELP